MSVKKYGWATQKTYLHRPMKIPHLELKNVSHNFKIF